MFVAKKTKNESKYQKLLTDTARGSITEPVVPPVIDAPPSGHTIDPAGCLRTW